MSAMSGVRCPEKCPSDELALQSAYVLREGFELACLSHGPRDVFGYIRCDRQGTTVDLPGFSGEAFTL